MTGGKIPCSWQHIGLDGPRSRYRTVCEGHRSANQDIDETEATLRSRANGQPSHGGREESPAEEVIGEPPEKQQRSSAPLAVRRTDGIGEPKRIRIRGRAGSSHPRVQGCARAAYHEVGPALSFDVVFLGLAEIVELIEDVPQFSDWESEIGVQLLTTRIV